MPALTPEQARRVYDRIARAQDWQRFYEDAATAELVAHAGFDNAHAVVELGCGTGRFAAALLAGRLPPDASYVGVDLSPRMVALASERLAPLASPRHRHRSSTAVPRCPQPTAPPTASSPTTCSTYWGRTRPVPRSPRRAGCSRRVGSLCATGLTTGRERARTLRVARLDGRVGALARARRRLPPDQACRRAGLVATGSPPSRHGRGMGRGVRGRDRDTALTSGVRRSSAP